MNFRLLFFFTLSTLLIGTNTFASDAPFDDAERARRIEILRDGVQKECKKLIQAAKDDKLHGHATRELSHVAHDLFVLKQDEPEAESLAKQAFAEQNVDPKSPDFGTVPWAVGIRAEKEDANAIEFTCLPVGAIMTRYRARLSPQFVTDITPHLHAALAAIRRHNVSVAYTNIYLMKISNLLLLGEAVGDADAVNLGLSNLDNWIAYTKKNGIGEFNSPTYMETQINSAGTAFNNTSNSAAKTRLHAVLSFLWADACASYYPPVQQLSGASSRDYSFIYGTGPVDRYFYLEGLRTDVPTPTLVNDMTGPFCDAIEGSFHPDEKMITLAKQTEKSFACGYGPDPWMNRTLFNTAAFSVGSAGAPYGNEDREIGIRFGTGRKLPIVSVFLDPFDKPDGSLRVKRKDNHVKPDHIKLNESLVQDRSTILAVYDLSTNLGKTPYSSLGLNIILPAHTDGLWLDGKKIDDTDMSDHPCTDKSIIILREGKAVLAARLFGVGGYSDFTPTYFLKHDIVNGDGFRLVAYAWKGDEKPPTDKHIPGATIINVQQCDNDQAFADFLKQSESLASPQVSTNHGVFETKFGSIEVALETATGKPAYRKLNGVEIHNSGPEEVNGWNLGELLNVP